MGNYETKERRLYSNVLARAGDRLHAGWLAEPLTERRPCSHGSSRSGLLACLVEWMVVVVVVVVLVGGGRGVQAYAVRWVINSVDVSRWQQCRLPHHRIMYSNLHAAGDARRELVDHCPDSHGGRA